MKMKKWIGNIKVNNIIMKRVDENFSNGQKVIITNDVNGKLPHDYRKN